MTFDAKAPPALKDVQLWFASIITRPIDNNSRMNPTSPSGIPMQEEAARYIVPSPTLEPSQRIELYNQQYWWRLLSVLQESFPFVLRLFGYQDFNALIAIPYLQRHPPNHWSLNVLGNDLPEWILKEYHSPDKDLVAAAAKIDWAFNDSFCAIQLPPLLPSSLSGEEGQEGVSEKDLYLQPHIHLFELKSDLFDLRMQFVKEEPEYWLENDFPPLSAEKTYHFVMYRTPENTITWKEIGAAEYHLLQLFKKGCSIDKACEWLEERGDAFYEEAARNLHLWFQLIIR